MAKETVPDLKELFRQAAEIAQQVPQNMQEAAFNRAIELLVGKPALSERTDFAQFSPRKGVQGHGIRKDQSSSDDLVQHIDSTRHPGVRSTAKVLDRSLMVLQIALQDHSVDGLNPVEISRILTEKFRVATTRQAVGMALKDASHLVDRVEEGKGYRYRIMGPGEEYLAHLQGAGEVNDNGHEKGGTKKARGRKRPKAQSKPVDPEHFGQVSTTDSRPTKKIRAKNSSSTAMGPKAAILSLVGQGFFAAAKTGPDVQDHLKTKRGFDLGTSQLRLAMLRLVRDGVLERDENDEGQYEYKKPK